MELTYDPQTDVFGLQTDPAAIIAEAIAPQATAEVFDFDNADDMDEFADLQELAEALDWDAP